MCIENLGRKTIADVGRCRHHAVYPLSLKCHAGSMGSDKRPRSPDVSNASLQAARLRLRQAAAASHAASRSWARERELQRGQTADMLADARHAAREVAATLARAERLADATTCPLRVWDEAATVVGETGIQEQNAEQQEDGGLVWVLEEAAGICEMFLQDATGGDGDSGNVIGKIDALLEAIGEDER